MAYFLFCPEQHIIPAAAGAIIFAFYGGGTLMMYKMLKDIVRD